jgi:hypothetical protein
MYKSKKTEVRVLFNPEDPEQKMTYEGICFFEEILGTKSEAAWYMIHLYISDNLEKLKQYFK